MATKTTSRREGALALAKRVLVEAPPFRQWPSQSLDDLASGSRIECYPAGTIVLRRGEPTPALYVVASGTVEISALNPDGRRLVIRYGGPNWAFGLLSVLDGKPMNHYCRAHEPMTAVVVPREVLLRVLRSHPELWEAVLREVLERNRFILAQFAEQAFEPLRVRLARALLVLVQSYGTPGEQDVAVKLRLGKDRLGELLGVSRQSVSKEIKRLEQQGILLMHYGRVLVHDLRALQEVAQHIR